MAGLQIVEPKHPTLAGSCRPIATGAAEHNRQIGFTPAREHDLAGEGIQLAGRFGPHRQPDSRRRIGKPDSVGGPHQHRQPHAERKFRRVDSQFVVGAAEPDGRLPLLRRALALGIDRPLDRLQPGDAGSAAFGRDEVAVGRIVGGLDRHHDRLAHGGLHVWRHIDDRRLPVEHQHPRVDDGRLQTSDREPGLGRHVDVGEALAGGGDGPIVNDGLDRQRGSCCRRLEHERHLPVVGCGPDGAFLAAISQTTADLSQHDGNGTTDLLAGQEGVGGGVDGQPHRHRGDRRLEQGRAGRGRQDVDLTPVVLRPLWLHVCR